MVQGRVSMVSQSMVIMITCIYMALNETGFEASHASSFNRLSPTDIHIVTARYDSRMQWMGDGYEKKVSVSRAKDLEGDGSERKKVLRFIHAGEMKLD